MSAIMEKKQWQELCEWAGFRHGWLKLVNEYWEEPRGNPLNGYPPQDMNTLFKWMVSKLHEQGWNLFMTYVGTDGDYWVHFENWQGGYFRSPIIVHKDSFEALSQAIYKAVLGKTKVPKGV